MLGILGDLHTRSTAPIERIDNYPEVHWHKLGQAFAHFKEINVIGIVAPGDIFNNYGRDSYEVLYDMIDFLKKYGIPMYVVKGQHDIRFHNLEVKDTPLQILIKSNLVYLLDNKGIEISKGVCLYGANFGEPLFRVPKKRRCNVNILVMHKMVINGKKLWADQTDYSQAKTLERRYGYDLYICGDNHNAFVNKKVIN